MEIKGKSYFKDKKKDIAYFESWVKKLEKNNERQYERYEIETSLGKTHVWGLYTNEEHLDTVVIFPGARTTALIWDFDKGLDNLNPGCLQPFSLTLKNLYFNLLPIIKPTEKNVLKFLDKAVFSKPNHKLSELSEKMLVEYEVFAISRYKDNTQKPYYMDKQLEEVKVDTFLLEGDKDLLFPFEKSIVNAKRQIKKLKEVKVFNNVGHGIETYEKALNYIGEQIKNYR